MEKRGISGMFKWIFALVAGMIIFLFLINFGYKHMSLSESKTSAVLLTSLESQLESLSISEFLSEDSLDLGREFTVNFDCNSLSTQDGKVETEKIIFSDSEITSKELILFTQKWNYPFPITNFFYIIDPQKTYYFFDQPYDLLFNLPSNVNILTYPDEVPDNAVLIFFKEPTNLAQYKNKQIKIIKDNQVTFYPQKTTSFYGDQMFLGAIFTDDFNKFECLKQKSLQKLKLISFVHQKRAQELAKTGCSELYQNIINQLEDFKNNLQNLNQLENLNKEIERNGCPSLF